MMVKKRVKPIAEKLTPRQMQAIDQACKGKYLLLIQCCLDAHKGVLQALKAIDLGVHGWGQGSMQHFLSLRHHLETYLVDDFAKEMYEQQLEQLEKDSNG